MAEGKGTALNQPPLDQTLGSPQTKDVWITSEDVTFLRTVLLRDSKYHAGFAATTLAAIWMSPALGSAIGKFVAQGVPQFQYVMLASPLITAAYLLYGVGSWLCYQAVRTRLTASVARTTLPINEDKKQQAVKPGASRAVTALYLGSRVSSGFSLALLSMCVESGCLRPLLTALVLVELGVTVRMALEMRLPPTSTSARHQVEAGPGGPWWRLQTRPWTFSVLCLLISGVHVGAALATMWEMVLGRTLTEVAVVLVFTCVPPVVVLASLAEASFMDDIPRLLCLPRSDTLLAAIVCRSTTVFSHILGDHGIEFESGKDCSAPGLDLALFPVDDRPGELASLDVVYLTNLKRRAFQFVVFALALHITAVPVPTTVTTGIPVLVLICGLVPLGLWNRRYDDFDKDIAAHILTACSVPVLHLLLLTLVDQSNVDVRARRGITTDALLLLVKSILLYKGLLLGVALGLALRAPMRMPASRRAIICGAVCVYLVSWTFEPSPTRFLDGFGNGHLRFAVFPLLELREPLGTAAQRWWAAGITAVVAGAVPGVGMCLVPRTLAAAWNLPLDELLVRGASKSSSGAGTAGTEADARGT